MFIAVVHLASSLMMQAAPAAKIHILPFQPLKVEATDPTAMQDVEGLYREAVSRQRGADLVSGATTREELAVVAKERPELHAVGPKDINQLPALFDTGVLMVGTVEGRYPDVVATFYTFDAGTRALKASHAERFSRPGTPMALRMVAIATYMLSANAVSGAIEAQCEEQGFRLAVDGEAVVECPGGVRLSPLPPGTHHVAVQGQGSQDVLEVMVTPNRVTHVSAGQHGGRPSLVVAQETTAMPGEFGTAVIAPKTGAAPVVTGGNTKQEGSGPSPLLYVGGGLAAGGAATALLGAALAAGGALATAAWPRESSGDRRVLAFGGEPVAVAQARVVAALALVPVGLVVGLLGLVMVGGGIVAALVPFVVGKGE
jgi:hypothetical protein